MTAAKKIEEKAARADARAVAIDAQWRLAAHLCAGLTRDELANLPIGFIATPALDSPILIFDVFDAPVRWIDTYNGRERHSSIELSELRADCIAYRRSHDGPKRAVLVRRIRRRWCWLVERAVGYSWPDLPQAVLLFDP